MTSKIQPTLVSNAIKKILILVLSLLVTFGALEVWVRMSAPIENYIQENVFSPSRSTEQEKYWRDLLVTQNISADTYNIYYFGESTMNGEPYGDTIPVMVDQVLQKPINGKEVRWVNMAERAIDTAESARRIRWVFDHQELTRPSLIVLYAGHNEYLKFHDCCGFSVSHQYGKTLQRMINSSKLVAKLSQAFRLYKLEIEDRSYFDQPVVPLNEFQAVNKHYEEAVRQIVNDVQKNKVPFIISTVASNYADFEPNRSSYCERNDRQDEFKQLMDRGLKLEKEAAFPDAKETYFTALNICDQFSETHYRLAKVYQAMNQPNDAWQEFELAVDLDRMPIRAQTSQNAYIRSLQNQEFVHVVDAVNALRMQDNDGLIGDNMMTDGHHPNLLGYNIIAQLIARKISMITNTNLPRPTIPEDFHNAFIPDLPSKKMVFMDSAEWFIRLSTWRFESSARLTKASEYLEKYAALGEPSAKQYVFSMIIAIIRHDIPLARQQLEKARQLNAKETDVLLKDYWISQFLERLTEI